jgi:hypothetical protein
MEYRSSNPDGIIHFGGDVVAGVNATAGVQLTSNTIQPCGDASAIDLNVKAKGTGQVFIGGSTTAFKIVAGESTTTLPNMPANSLQNSTFAAAGISTGDLILFVDARGVLSTEVGMAGYTCTAANEINVRWINPHASSITAETTGVTMRWAYIDRT